MALIETFLLRVRRADSPFYRVLHQLAAAVLNANVPVPAVLRPVLRGVYTLHFAVLQAARQVLVYLYYDPLARARFASTGKRVRVMRLPRIHGKPRIHAADNVQIHGVIHVFDAGSGGAELILEDGAQLGHNVTLVIAKRILVGAGAGIASECFVTDVADAAFDANERMPAVTEAVTPVHVGSKAWVGRGSSILGVSIGEAAIVGAGSVVNKDVPAFSVAIGNPARVVVRTSPGCAG